MTSWSTAPLGELVIEFPKSPYKVRDAVSNGPYPFFTSGARVLAFEDSLCEGANLFIATGGRAMVQYHDGPAAYSTDCLVVTTKPGLDAKFLYYFLQGRVPDIDRTMFEGAALRHLKKPKLREMPIPVPSPAEQADVIRRLDGAMSDMDDLRGVWQESRRKTREVFDAYLHKLLISEGASWERLALSTLLERGWIRDHMDGNHGSDYPRKDEFVPSGVPYISAQCVVDDEIDLRRAKYLSPERATRLRKGFARDRDVLFAHNATVGPVAILRTQAEQVVLGTSLTYYRCDGEHILPEYLAHYMRSAEFRIQYEQVMRQSTRNQVPITKQREFIHVVPPVEDQKRILAILDDVLSHVQQLTKAYLTKLEMVESLRSAVLHASFSERP